MRHDGVPGTAARAVCVGVTGDKGPGTVVTPTRGGERRGRHGGGVVELVAGAAGGRVAEFPAEAIAQEVSHRYQPGTGPVRVGFRCFHFHMPGAGTV